MTGNGSGCHFSGVKTVYFCASRNSEQSDSDHSECLTITRFLKLFLKSVYLRLQLVDLLLQLLVGRSLLLTWGFPSARGGARDGSAVPPKMLKVLLHCE